MTTDAIQAAIASLSRRVDKIAADVAVLVDRRSDTIDVISRTEAVAVRVAVLERQAIARRAQWRVVIVIASASAALGGLLVKLLGA